MRVPLIALLFGLTIGCVRPTHVELRTDDLCAAITRVERTVGPTTIAAQEKRAWLTQLAAEARCQ